MAGGMRGVESGEGGGASDEADDAVAVVVVVAVASTVGVFSNRVAGVSSASGVTAVWGVGSSILRLCSERRGRKRGGFC